MLIEHDADILVQGHEVTQGVGGHQFGGTSVVEEETERPEGVVRVHEHSCVIDVGLKLGSHSSPTKVTGG